MRAERKSFRAALIQLRSSRDVDANLAMAVHYIRLAAREGANYVQTPENTLLMETGHAQLLAKCESEERTPAIAAFAQLARECGIWLHIGSIAIKAGADRAVNRAFLFSPEGGIRARYDKIHMFDVNLPSGEIYRESALYTPGKSAVITQLPWGGLGITTCYDLRFPEQYKALANAGADFMAVPSAFTKITGEAHWHVLLRARAIENGCYILAAAQGGRHESGRTTFGHSLVISPWGEVLTEAGTEPGVLYATIDPARVTEARSRIPSLNHTRDFTVVELPESKERYSSGEAA
jgi:predicted amidohydrolase